MSHPDPIPQANPRATFQEWRHLLLEAFSRVVDNGQYILGPEVNAFERAFAAWLGSGHAIGVANGTDAIELALRGLGVGSGDLVFAPSLTAVATIAAIERSGATPALVEVDPYTHVMDPTSLAETIRHAARHHPELRPRAVVAVHLYGQPAPLPELLAVAREHHLALVEDCAQAHGARYQEQPVGRWGEAAAFSFYPTKNLGALGDGGMVVAGEEALAQRIRRLRQYGWDESRTCREPGINSRLDELQAAILGVLLPHLDRANTRRRAIAARYRAALPQAAPTVARGAHHVYHQYVLRLRDREAVRRHLAQAGIGSAIHYPVPAHLHPAYRERLPLSPGGLPVTERTCAAILSLPMFPQLTDQQVDRVVEVLAHLPATGWV